MPNRDSLKWRKVDVEQIKLLKRIPPQNIKWSLMPKKYKWPVEALAWRMVSSVLFYT